MYQLPTAHKRKKKVRVNHKKKSNRNNKEWKTVISHKAQHLFHLRRFMKL